ncbi:ciliary-associated calcium-binding coiled-coil protein 1 isoform X1 [Petromyzon marinus]|uniref:ciliary-associated calcium-binding coiled-coil protein 1 isoform X1 n=1 Tax=Petromyzon marinus TaxID=7757 RepID=UPI003F70678B
MNDDAVVTEEKDVSKAEIVLSFSQVESLASLTLEEVQTHLAEMLHLREHETSLREAALLDVYVSAYRWAREHGFSSQQILYVVTLLHTLLQNIEERRMKLVENLKACSRQLVGVGCDDLACLSLEQGKLVLGYLTTSLFQHYRLYEFVFTQPQDVVIIDSQIEVEMLEINQKPFPLPLEEGIDADIYERYMCPRAELTENAEEPIVEEAEEEERMADPPADYPSGDDPLRGHTLAEVRTTLEEVAAEMIGELQVAVSEKLKLQEETYKTRLDKLRQVEMA